ncbi:MAG: hypothetical protein J4G09_06660 [Proteobacteria bacterium]|nr:hypothetical protein [Pseudomonadota bacterium]
MPRWSNCRIEVRPADGDSPFRDDDCDVTLDEGRLIVSYFDDEGPLVFEAPEPETGPFELVCRSRPRRATLALSDDRARLHGRWRERDLEGEWTIFLDPPQGP